MTDTLSDQTGRDGASHLADSAFLRLERWGWQRGWCGSDPYDALNATRFAGPLKRTVLGRRILTQAVKRSPVDLRPLLRITPGPSAAASALVASAYATQSILPEEDGLEKLNHMVDLLLAQRLPGYEGACWGYHFDVQTRVFFYPKSSPNTIASAFAGFALLDAHARTGRTDLLERAEEAVHFFVRHVPQTSGRRGAFFGYLVGDRTPIHNSSMLTAALLARVGRAIGAENLCERAQEAVTYTVDLQRPDGSWPYGEKAGLEWVDNFHTAYILMCLEYCRRSGLQDCERAFEAGMEYYKQAFFLPDGTPKYHPDSVYPVDSQCAAEAIHLFALMGDAQQAELCLAYATQKLARHDGSYVFRRERLWTIRQPHIRWVQAPFLRALAALSSLYRR